MKKLILDIGIVGDSYLFLVKSGIMLPKVLLIMLSKSVRKGLSL